MDTTRQQNNSLTFFIPGVMGSTLRYRGPGEYGQPVDEEIWGSDLWSNADLLATKPSRLAAPNVEAQEVLRELRTGRFLRVNVYRELLDYCSSEIGLSLDTNGHFHPFAYDWRADNRESARKLAQFIIDVDPSEKLPVKIIAHSMGGIVARLMLLENEAILHRTTLLFQIASPIAGSAKAFYTLKKSPRFDRIFDSLWKVFHNLNPDRRAQLQQTLQGFPSLYQLLPPSNVKTIYDNTGRQYSAVDSELWPAQLGTFLQAATEVHQLLQQPLESTIKCIYSNAHKTDVFYLVNQLFHIVASQCVDGDGTVCCSSAFAQTDTEQRHLIEGKGADHNALCRNPEVFKVLKASFV